MVIDTLDNLAKYEALNPLFKDVVRFLKENDIMSLAAGKYTIKGDELYVNVTTAKGKSPDKAVMETHNKMTDIQIPISTAETYGYTPRKDLPQGTYDAAKDITKMPGILGESLVTCEVGMFAIFFPQDGHAPCITSEAEIKKAIFKVAGK